MDMEKMMTHFPTVFTSPKRASVRRLLASLGSNLDPNNPVMFDWDIGDMQFLYDQGQYCGSVSRGKRMQDNLYEEPDQMFEDALNMPNPMENPSAFRAAVESG